MRIPNIVGVAANIFTDDNEYGFGIFDDKKLLSIHIIVLLYADIVFIFSSIPSACCSSRLANKVSMIFILLPLLTRTVKMII